MGKLRGCMPGQGQDYAVFSEGEGGAMWRAFSADLESAKARAQQLAIDDGIEVFVFSFNDASEVARFFPKPNPKASRV